MTKDFNPIEVLAVAPGEGVGEESSVPKEVAFGISYYQWNMADKRLIIVEMEYGNVEALSEEEDSGRVSVDYNLTFALSALSHRDLTIAFAFSSDFYVVLYVLVGILSLAVMTIFACFHRLVARPPENQTVAKFKFSSFFMLTIPPALSGSGMGMLPVLIADLFIAGAIVGEIFYLETPIFECTAAEGGVACPLTFLDVIVPDPDAVSTDYSVVRTGRCGTCLLASGLYLMREGMVILIPDKSE